MRCLFVEIGPHGAPAALIPQVWIRGVGYHCSSLVRPLKNTFQIFVHFSKWTGLTSIIRKIQKNKIGPYTVDIGGNGPNSQSNSPIR